MKKLIVFFCGVCFIACVSSKVYADDVVADYKVKTPKEMKKNIARAKKRLQNTLNESQKSIRYEQTFDKYKVQKLGAGKHGEKILDKRFLLGYPGKVNLDKIFAEIVNEDKSRKLKITDNLRGCSIFTRLRLLTAAKAGNVQFDFKMDKVRPFSITLNAYSMVLTLPNEYTWQKWFPGEPQTNNLVYLEHKKGGYNPRNANRRNNFTPIKTSMVISPGVKYTIKIAWKNYLATIWVNDEAIITDKAFLSNSPVEVVAWSASSFKDNGLIDNGTFTIDNVILNINKFK